MNLKPIAIFVFIVINLTIFARVSKFDFLWRDQDRIVDVLQNNSVDLKSIWTHRGIESFAPLTYTIWYGLSRLDHSAGNSLENQANDAHGVPAKSGGIDPRWFHILNIVGHLTAGIAALLILELMLNNLLAAWLGALLFTIHPMQVEAVSLAYGLKTILGGAFSLLSIWQYLVFSGKINSYRSEERSQAWRSVTLATCFYILGCLANPIAVVTPVFAAVLEKLLPGQRSLLSDRKPKGPLVLWLIIAIPVMISAIGVESISHEMPSFWQRPFLLSGSFWLYLAKAIAPINLAPDYGWTPIRLLSRWETYASLIPTIAIVVGLLWWRERPRTWAAATFFLFLMAILPTSGVLKFGFQRVSTISDRFAYMSIFALCLGFGYALSARRAQMLQIFGIVFTIVLAYMAREQTNIWQSPQNLWKHTVAVNPNSMVARIELGRSALHRGDNQQAFEHFSVVEKAGGADATLYLELANVEAKLGVSDAAIAHYKKAIELNHNVGRAYSGLARALFDKGQYQEAIGIFEKAIQINDRDVDTLLHYGIALEKQGQFENARKSLTRALELSPNNATGQALLGSVEAKLNHPAEAIRHLQAAIEAKVEDPATHLILANVLYSQGKLEEAEPHYEAALEAFPDSFEAHNNLGVILVSQKKYDQGLQHIQQALKIAPGDAEVFQNMAIAMFHLRRLQEAQRYFAKALNQNPRLPNAYFYQGEIARFQGDKAKARSLYYTAIKYDRDHAEAHQQLGNMDYQDEAFEKAVYHFEAALRSRPGSEKAQASLQRAKRQLDRKGAH